MSTDRNDRRRQRKAIVNHPVMKRFSRNLKRVGREALEMYRVDGETPEQHVYFDVFSMREWATANLDIVATPMDWERAEQLIASGAVDRQRIAQHTIQSTASPVIFGRGANGRGGDQILDGAHTYVALALGATASGEAGRPVPVPTYLLQPDQWNRFVIPNFIAKALDFDATFDADDRTWSAQAGDWDNHFDR